jgi:hypothetical protein
MIAGTSDIYEALLSRGPEAEDIWYKYQEAVVSEVKAAHEGK